MLEQGSSEASNFSELSVNWRSSGEAFGFPMFKVRFGGLPEVLSCSTCFNFTGA